MHTLFFAEGGRYLGFGRLVLAGKSDLAEIAILCAVEMGATVVAIVDPPSEGSRFVGVEVVGAYSDVKGGFDAIIVTDVAAARQASYELAVEASGKDRIAQCLRCWACVRKEGTEDVA